MPCTANAPLDSEDRNDEPEQNEKGRAVTGVCGVGQQRRGGHVRHGGGQAAGSASSRRRRNTTNSATMVVIMSAQTNGNAATVSGRPPDLSPRVTLDGVRNLVSRRPGPLCGSAPMRSSVPRKI